MEILSSITNDCRGLAGVKKLYLFSYVKYPRSSIVVDNNILTGFPTSELYEFYTIGDVSFTENITEDDGGKYYDISLSFKTKVFDEALKLVNKDIRAVIQDNNGNYRLLGNYNGLTCESFNKTTGQSKSDFNGLEFTFSGKELRESFFFYNLEVVAGEAGLSYLLQENGDYLLQQNGYRIVI